MSASDDEPYSSPLADRLVTACLYGDLRSAKAAVADGASVNEKGRSAPWVDPAPPLAAAVNRRHYDVVVWLLSHGADVNGDHVLWNGAVHSTAAILQLIDAGCDLNQEIGGSPLLTAAWGNDNANKVRVLLAQPSLDLIVQHNGKTPEQYALYRTAPPLEAMIAREVSGTGLPTSRGKRADGV